MRGQVITGLRRLRPEVLATREVQFALEVYNVYQQGNWTAFFALARGAPYVAACLMHFFFNKLRSRALQVLHTTVRSAAAATHLNPLREQRSVVFGSVPFALRAAAAVLFCFADWHGAREDAPACGQARGVADDGLRRRGGAAVRAPRPSAGVRRRRPRAALPARQLLHHARRDPPTPPLRSTVNPTKRATT
jgi:hypothetical protein